MKTKLLLVASLALLLTSQNTMYAQVKSAKKGASSTSVSKELNEKEFKQDLGNTENFISEIKMPSVFKSKLASIKSSGLTEQSVSDLSELNKKVREVLSAQNIIDWMNISAVESAVDQMKKGGKVDAASLDKKLSELKSLVNKGFNIYTDNPAEEIAAAHKALKLKREILLSSPAVDVDKFISAKFKINPRWSREVGAGSLGVQPNNWSNISSASRDGHDGEIIEVEGLKNGDIKYKSIYKPENKGALVTDLAMHWDGDKVMFTSVNDQKRFQVYELNLKDNTVRQAVKINEPDLEFFDAAYLPDGRIIAVSNIGYQGVPCVNGSDQVGNMVLYNPKDNNLRRLTYDQDANWHPIVLANGKVMYVRWEYTDLTHYFSRIVMHMNPDGTEQKSLYGSGSMFPNSIFDIQPLPEHTNRFVGITSGHHGVVRAGRMMTFDPAKSRKEEKGMLQEYPFKGRPIIPIIKDEMVNGVWPQLIKPYPIDDNTFIVSAKLTPSSLWGLYLIDSFDNVTLLAESEDAGFIYGIPVKKRPTPPIIPDRVKLDEKEASVYIQDIYEGEGLRGVKRGEVKELRVFAYEYAYVNSLSDHYAHGIQAGWDLKRLIGTVPVEEDGSVTFKIPANTPISLQPLDSEGRAIQWMRSWLTGMPGEVVSCVGCHEDQNTLPMPKSSIASKKAPSAIKLTEGGIHSISFDTEVQPILERACVACHDGSKPSMPNFKDTTSVGITDWSGTRYFQKNYLAFHPYVSRQGPEADMYVMSPYEYHASTSLVVRKLKGGHHGVELTDSEWRNLYTWIDMNTPANGVFVANEREGFDQIDRRAELANRYGNGTGVDWRREIRDYAKYLDSKGKITPVMPKETPKPTYKEVTVKGWPMSEAQIKDILSQEKESRKDIEVAPGVKITFVRIPAGQFVMGNNNGSSSEAPSFKADVKSGFWMSEKEISNEEYNALVPEHDSRIYAQFWKDHVSPGYPANLPGQPVVRVSQEEATKYAEELSKKTGLKIALPTEVQWEWAARGGSASDFWYGDKSTDFGKYANLADVQLEKMAVTGVDPQPMTKDNPWFEYYNYLPKVSSVDDGHMLPIDGGSYATNQFGLYDIIGNLWEWTRSSFDSYPLTTKSTPIEANKVVARGGSYIDRPKDATVSTRRDYLPWQRVNCVGFRLVIED